MELSENGGANADVSVLVESARAAGVPEATLNRLLVAGFRNRVLSDVVADILSLLVTAHAENLPVKPLVDKLNESLSKRISLDRTIAVLERIIDDLAYVRKLVQQTSATEESLHSKQIIRLAETLIAGTTRDELGTFLEDTSSAPLSMRIVAVEILTYCKQIDFDSNITRQIVAAGVEHRSLTSEWQYLAKVIVKAKKRGLSDKRIGEAAIRVLEKNGSVRELMTELDFTTRDLRREPL